MLWPKKTQTTQQKSILPVGLVTQFLSFIPGKNNGFCHLIRGCISASTDVHLLSPEYSWVVQFFEMIIWKNMGHVKVPWSLKGLSPNGSFVSIIFSETVLPFLGLLEFTNYWHSQKYLIPMTFQSSCPDHETIIEILNIQEKNCFFSLSRQSATF